jgi:hypothetical protein
VFVIGLDLGQKQDYTAVAVVEKEERSKAGEKPMLYLRHLERYALATPYGEQMDRVAALVEKINGQANQGRPPELIVDATGVGVGVVEMLKDRGLRYRAVSITGGVTETISGGTYHVPKRNLVSQAVAPFEGKRLKIAKGMRLVPAQLPRTPLPGTPVNKRWFSFAVVVARRKAGLRSWLGSPLSSRAR